MPSPSGLLALVRHGQSTDNEKNLFSGWRDPDLTTRGIEEARQTGRLLKAKGITFDVAFTSLLGRARRTLDLILEEIGQAALPIIADVALNERDYGELSGLNKEGARAVWGSEQVRLWRKSYEAVPPGGESLAMTAARTIPYVQREIEPRVLAGQRVLVVAHGNSLRSVVKQLEGLDDTQIEIRNIATAEVTFYEETDGVIRPRVPA